MPTRVILALLVLLALLHAPSLSSAATVEEQSESLAGIELEEEAGEEEEEAEVCEETAWAEECEEAEEGEAAASRSEECPLRSANAHAVVDRRDKRLKLTIGYTTYEPVKAKIEVGRIATLSRHLGRSGVLRVVKTLRKGQHLNRLVVRIRIPSAPGYCTKLQTKKVAVH